MMTARELTVKLGGEWRGNAGLAPCPVCQTERRHDQRGLSLLARDGALLAYCHKSGCNFHEILSAARLPRDSSLLVPQAHRDSATSRDEYAAAQLVKARQLWKSCKPLHGTKGETYLRGRGITCSLPLTLAWANDAFHSPSTKWLSAMVGDVSTGGVHRTFFEKAGRRITGQAKMMQGPCAGGAVPLSCAFDEAHNLPNSPLVVCEGIETGLSLLSGLLSGPATVWAALSTSGMKALELPAPVGRLIVAADGDAPGREAAYALALRAIALGWNVSLWPAPDGQDWNDVLVQKGGSL